MKLLGFARSASSLFLSSICSPLMPPKYPIVKTSKTQKDAKASKI
jgi:hypothetical protein